MKCVSLTYHNKFSFIANVVRADAVETDVSSPVPNFNGVDDQVDCVVVAAVDSVGRVHKLTAKLRTQKYIFGIPILPRMESEPT